MGGEERWDGSGPSRDEWALFAKETAQHLGDIERGARRLCSASDPENVDRMFRAAHTLKGSAATAGHRRLASLAHALESLLDGARRGAIKPCEEMSATILDTADRLRALAPAVTGDGEFGRDEVAGVNGAAGQATGFAVSVELDDGCAMPGVRCYQVLDTLDRQGHVSWCEPPRRIIESGGGGLRLAARLEGTCDERLLRDAIEAIGDVNMATVTAGGCHALPGDGGHPDSAGAAWRRDVSARLYEIQSMLQAMGDSAVDRDSATISGATLSRIAGQLGALGSEVEGGDGNVRFLPIGTAMEHLPALALELASTTNTDIEVRTEGEAVLAPLHAVAALRDALVQLVRNAAGHGIEEPIDRLAAGKPATGMIQLTAWSDGTAVYVSVRDDGRGIATDRVRRKAVDLGLVADSDAAMAREGEVLRYVLQPGLTTATQVTELSGRGVGMDIVRTTIESLGGGIQVHSTPGQGTEFVIRVPLAESGAARERHAGTRDVA